MVDVETHPEEPLPRVRLPLATPARSPSELLSDVDKLRLGLPLDALLPLRPL